MAEAGMKNIKPFRLIYKQGDDLTQFDLLKDYISRRCFNSDTGCTNSSIPIDRSLVPRIVSAQQYDVIMFRRSVRISVEEARLKSGIKADGRRSERYKYRKRHESALARERDRQGTFAASQSKASISFPALSN